MSAETIYRKLIAAGLTPAGACGLMGNLYAESNLQANIVQKGMSQLGDTEYTYAVDSSSDGKYKVGGLEYSFFYDSVGYGLAQWTYYTRKQNLFNYAKKKGVSIGDEAMQIEFLLKEMREEYVKVLNTLKNPEKSVYDCAYIVCTDFERPAYNNIAARNKFAEEFYQRFVGKETTAAVNSSMASVNSSATSVNPAVNADQSIMTMQAVLTWNGYWNGTCDGVWTKDFAEKLVEFANDVKGQGG